MPVYYDGSRKRWRYEFSRFVGGRRRRATKLLPQAWTRKQAEAYAHEQDARLYAVATGAVRPQPLISEAVRMYLTEHAPSLKGAQYVERDLALCMDAYAGRYMNELAEVAREYAKKHATTLAPATIRVRMAYLRSACRWAWKHKSLGDHDPAERMTLPKVRNERHTYITRAEAIALAREIGSLWARACVLVAFYSGMRLGELMRAEPTARGWLLTDTKNGERRLVPIHPKVAYLARQWPPQIAARTVEAHFLRAARARGHTDLRFHDLRHSAASEMINAGIDLYVVGGVLGHRAHASTKRYAHLASDTLKAAVSSIGRRVAKNGS